MNNKQLHYYYVLKTAVLYLKKNKRYINNLQLLRLYKRIKSAEFRGLSNKYRIENPLVQSPCINGIQRDIPCGEHSDHDLIKEAVDTNHNPVLMTSDVYDDGLMPPIEKSFSKIKLHEKYFDIRFLISMSMVSVIGSVSFMYSALRDSDSTFLLIVILLSLILGFCIKIFNDDHICDISKIHLTTYDEFLNLVMDIFHRYSKSIYSSRTNRKIITPNDNGAINKSWAKISHEVLSNNN